MKAAVTGLVLAGTATLVEAKSDSKLCVAFKAKYGATDGNDNSAKIVQTRCTVPWEKDATGTSHLHGTIKAGATETHDFEHAPGVKNDPFVHQSEMNSDANKAACAAYGAGEGVLQVTTCAEVMDDPRWDDDGSKWDMNKYGQICCGGVDFLADACEVYGSPADSDISAFRTKFADFGCSCANDNGETTSENCDNDAFTTFKATDDDQGEPSDEDGAAYFTKANMEQCINNPGGLGKNHRVEWTSCAMRAAECELRDSAEDVKECKENLGDCCPAKPLNPGRFTAGNFKAEFFSDDKCTTPVTNPRYNKKSFDVALGSGCVQMGDAESGTWTAGMSWMPAYCDSKEMGLVVSEGSTTCAGLDATSVVGKIGEHTVPFVSCKCDENDDDGNCTLYAKMTCREASSAGGAGGAADEDSDSGAFAAAPVSIAALALGAATLAL